MGFIRCIVTVVTALVATNYIQGKLLDGEGCESPQYLELGRTEIINCSFQGEFFAIFWVNSSDQTETPLVRLKKDGVSGKGYDSNEFDIHDNGSLIINHVRLEHEHIFTVLLFRTSSGSYDVDNVQVITTVQPPQTRPHINNCDSETEICFLKIKKDSRVECSVTNARPAVDLRWTVITEYGDRNVSFETNVTDNNARYSTVVSTVDVFQYSSILALLVCVEDSEPKILQKNVSLMLVQNSDFDLLSALPEEKTFVKGTNIELNCSRENLKYITWNYKHSLEERSKVILYAAVYGDDAFTSEPLNIYRFGANGSLIIDDIDINHEGIYSCMSGNGVSEELMNYNVTVYVTAFPVVNGCSPHQYCVITSTSGTGHLTCKIEGIRPKVQLEWREVKQSSNCKITFKNHERTVSSKGNLSDVMLTSQYQVQQPITESRITIECRVVGTGIDVELFGKPATLDVHVLSSNAVTDSSPLVTTEKSGWSPWWLILIIVPVCLTLLFGFVIFRKVKKNNPSSVVGDPEEAFPMLPDGSSDTIRKFIKQLKAKYEILYNAVHPLPYIRDRMYCVDKVFVASGIQEMKSRDKWTELKSYHDILKNSVNRFARIILESEPGFGKSTLSLQLVYDWCNGISLSPLRDVQIVIFLRLRQLGGVKSIAQAVRQFILPKDSPFREDDFQNMLQNCSSIFIILDGFDEYQDQDNDVISDVMNIIKGEMFQQACVLVTTRSKCIPKDYAPQSKRMRLLGFNSNAQTSYIQKAVVDDDQSKGEDILRRLNENTVLSDLCQIPLFFVMFAHMTYEDETFQEFTSVSTCFRYVIGCFHAHLKNKLGDKTFKSQEANHDKLDEVAFDSLKRGSRQIVWSKEELVGHLGQDCYSYYVQVGILVEEEVLSTENRPTPTSSSLVEYKTEVRFCHKLFCEWYAAHRFAEIVSTDKSILGNMNPFDIQYVFQFACGLKPKAAENIISYVRSLDGGDKFSVLCFLEQTGKDEEVLETIRNLCASEVIFDGSDTKLLQRSTVQLLEMASSNGIEIARVELYDCVQFLDLNLGSLILSSGIPFHKLSSINQLVVYEEGKHVPNDKAKDIIKFGNLCHGLQTLAFYRCIMPQSLGKLQLNFSVWWSPSTDARYSLTPSGRWETVDKKKLSYEKYQNEIRKFKEQSQPMDGHKNTNREDNAS